MQIPLCSWRFSIEGYRVLLLAGSKLFRGSNQARQYFPGDNEFCFWVKSDDSSAVKFMYIANDASFSFLTSN